MWCAYNDFDRGEGGLWPMLYNVDECLLFYTAADILCGAPTAFFFAASSIGQYDSILMTPSSVRASRACADQGGQLPLQLLVKPQCLTKLNQFLTTHHPGVRRLSYSRSWFDNHGPQMRPAGESEPVLCQRKQQ